MAHSMSSSPSTAGGSGTSTQEYTIRVPKNTNKKYHVMRFTSERDLDFRKWSNVKMERENNMKEFKGLDEDQPKFGAGSEFGREQREEARRKKFGIVTRKYKADDQPWLLKVGGKTGKKYKGIRDGGVSENAAYYVFTQTADGSINAYPLNEWYNFQAIQRFKALTAEEAEEAYGKRNKTMNFFSLMLRKRLRPDAEEVGEEGEEGKKGKKGSGKKDLTISEMEEWMNSSDDSGSDEGEKDSDEEKKKAKGKKAAAKNKKKKKKGSDDEALEESDDGDEEGREHEYISDSSSSESELEETKQLKGVAEEDALRKLLDSEEDSEEGEGSNRSNAEDNESGADEPDKADDKDKKSKKKKKKKKAPAKEPPTATKKKGKKGDMGSLIPAESSSSLSSDSTDDESKTKKDKKETPGSAGGSRSGTPTVLAKAEGAEPSSSGVKRKAEAMSGGPSSSTSTSTPPVKKSRTEGSCEGGMMEESVRRYLARKPMTTTELLQKFKSKKTGMSSEQLVNVMTQILKKINPTKQTIKGKMYLSIKS